MQEFHLFGVVFLPPNPLEEVFGRPFESRMAVRMTLPYAPMEMKIGVGKGDFRWRCSVLNKLTLLTYQYETKQEEG